MTRISIITSWFNKIFFFSCSITTSLYQIIYMLTYSSAERFPFSTASQADISPNSQHCQSQLLEKPQLMYTIGAHRYDFEKALINLFLFICNHGMMALNIICISWKASNASTSLVTQIQGHSSTFRLEQGKQKLWFPCKQCRSIPCVFCSICSSRSHRCASH